jgi:hypothetical protein
MPHNSCLSYRCHKLSFLSGDTFQRQLSHMLRVCLTDAINSASYPIHTFASCLSYSFCKSSLLSDTYSITFLGAGRSQNSIPQVQFLIQTKKRTFAGTGRSHDSCLSYRCCEFSFLSDTYCNCTALPETDLSQ